MPAAGRPFPLRPSESPARTAAARYRPPAERTARGKSCRSKVPRESHAVWEPRPDRRDPIALLEEQAAERVPELVPIRYGRMSASPFAFYRGAAYVMASDLAGTPQTGIRVQLCGDAHLANFGGFASPERQLLFDLNDFDETLPGPWEWDVKRLAASVAVAGHENGFKPKRREAMLRQMVREYRHAIRQFATMKTLDVWYARANLSDLQELLRSQGNRRQIKRLNKAVAKGRRKDSARAFAKLAVQDNGEARIRADPPLIVPIQDLVDRSAAHRLEHDARQWLTSASYLRSLSRDRRQLLDHYRYADLARKVVGVGSVGTRCWVILLVGTDSSDALFLQAKQAPRSVLERFAGGSEFSNQGQRVVEGQRLMQAASDIFLGWLRAANRSRRAQARPLRPSALGLEDLVQHRRHAAVRHGPLRQGLRVDARPRSRLFRRLDRNRQLPGFLRRLRSRHRSLCRRLRRPERERPRGAAARNRDRAHTSRARHLSVQRYRSRDSANKKLRSSASRGDPPLRSGDRGPLRARRRRARARCCTARRGTLLLARRLAQGDEP